MIRVSKTAGVLFAGLLLCAPMVCAQQGDPGGNPPPATQGESSSQASPYDQALQPGAPLPDDRSPISGVQMPRLGGLNLGRSFLIPSLSLQQMFDTNSQNASSSASRSQDFISNVSGSLALNWMGRKSNLDLNYVGSGFLFNTTTRSHQFVQGLTVNDSFLLGRWTMTLGNSFSYIPQSLYGLGGYGFNPGSQVNSLGGNLGAGTPGTSYNPSFLPGQNILGTGRRILDSTVAQAQYMLGRRSSLNVSASYGVVYFLDPGFFNSRSITARGGYDFNINSNNLVGVSYAASLFSFSGTSNHFGSHAIYFSYSHRISGRLSAMVEAGPSISLFNGVQGPAGTTTTTSGHQLSWSVTTHVGYATTLANFQASYSRRNNEGSGFLLGAQSNSVLVSIGRQLTRLWTGSINGGYIQNDSLNNFFPGVSNALRYSGWQAGVLVGRPISRSMNVSLHYSVDRQTSNASACLNATTCGTVALRQTVGLNFSWSHQPIALE